MATIDLAEYKYSLTLDSSEYDKNMTNAGIQAETMKSKLSSVGSFMKTALVGGLVAVGAAVGKTLVDSVKTADEFKKAMNGFSAETGVAGKDADAFNEALKNIYSQNYGENFEDIASAMGTVKKNLNDLDATQVEKVTKNALTLRDTFDIDVNESVRSASTLMKQFGITGDEAYNLIAQGAQNGLDFSGEMLDSVDEYSVQFKKFGLSADDMFNMMKSGAESGAFNLDKVGDAVKELSIRAVDGSKTTVDAYKSLGLNADDTAQKFAKGGDSAKSALSQVTKSLSEVKDPVEQNRIGVELFGTQWEDLGTKAVLALSDTKGSIDKTKDAMGEINKVKYNSFGEAMTGIKRQLETSILLPMGEKLLPILSKFSQWLNDKLPSAINTFNGVMKTVGSFIEPIVPLVKSVIDSFTGAGSSTKTSFDGIKKTISDVLTAVKGIVKSFVDLFKTIWDKWGNDIVSFAKKYLTDVLNNFKNVFKLIQSVVDTVTALIKGDWKGFFEGIKNIAKNALNLLKGLFKTSFDLYTGIIKGAFTVIKTVVSTIFTAIKNNVGKILDSIKTNVSKAFTTIVNTLKNLPSNILKILTKVITNVIDWKTKLVNKGKEAAKGLSEAIINAIKGLPKNMTTIGKNLVQGIWNGISNAKQWVIDKVEGFGTDIINSIKGIFGIHSPSRVMRDQVGYNLALGIVEGMNKGKGKIKKTAQEMGEELLSSARTKLDNYKVYNKMSLADEVTFWNKIRKECKKGTQARIDADKEYYAAKAALKAEPEQEAAELLSSAKTALDNKKVYHKMSLDEEVEYWDKVRKQLKKSTQARIDADKEYYTAVEASKTEQAKILEEKLQAEKTYSDNVEKINDDLVKNIKAAADEYNNAVESRTSAITSSLGLFDAYAKKTDVTGQQLIDNLRTQVTGISDWSTGLNQLKNRGISEGLLTELQKMGVSASGEISALNTLTDTQLNEYVLLWQEKNKLAKDQAIGELEGLKTETSTKIQELTVQANTDIQGYYKIYTDAMKKLKVAIKDPITTLKTTISTDGEGIVINVTKAMEKKAKSKETKTTVKAVNTEITDILGGMIGKSTNIGTSIVQGIISGMEAQKKALAISAASLVSATISSAKKAGKINSPSRLMRDEVGKYLAQGIGVGFTDEMDNVNKSIQDSINSDFDLNTNSKLLGGITDGQAMSNIEKSISNSYGNNSYSNPISINMGDIHISGTANQETINQLNRARQSQTDELINRLKTDLNYRGKFTDIIGGEFTSKNLRLLNNY